MWWSGRVRACLRGCATGKRIAGCCGASSTLIVIIIDRPLASHRSPQCNFTQIMSAMDISRHEDIAAV